MCSVKVQESACRARGCSPHVCPPNPATHSRQAEREREALQRRFDDAVLAAQQRSAVRAAVLERRLEAASSELALAQQASSVPAAASGYQASPAAGVAGRSRATSAAQGSATASHGGSSRRGSRVPGPADWVAAMLEAALHTPLPDGDASLIEDDAPCQIMQQIAELEAADASSEASAGATGAAAAWQGATERAEAEAGVEAAAAGPGSAEGQASGARTSMSGKAQLLGAEQSTEPLAALEAKLSQAALAAQSAAVVAAGGEAGGQEVRIAAHRGSQLG